jgi:hypothetical protein
MVFPRLQGVYEGGKFSVEAVAGLLRGVRKDDCSEWFRGNGEGGHSEVV